MDFAEIRYAEQHNTCNRLGEIRLCSGKVRLFETFLAIVVLAILANGLKFIGVPSCWPLSVKDCVIMGLIIWGKLHNTSRDMS